MTDEEMAKEYVDKLYAEKVSKEDYDKDGWILYRCEDISDAYLAGLKAGRPKWHKVADGDLPDNTDSVLSDKGVIVYYNFTHACWVDERASVEIDDVIAWCEIPQYEEEKLCLRKN